MSKRQLIDEIICMNRTAKPEFLAGFREIELERYLRQLQSARTSPLTGDWMRFAKYFAGVDNIASSEAQYGHSACCSAYETAELVVDTSGDGDELPALVVSAATAEITAENDYDGAYRSGSASPVLVGAACGQVAAQAGSGGKWLF